MVNDFWLVVVGFYEVENNEYAAKNYEKNECYFLSVNNDEKKRLEKTEKKVESLFLR